MLIVRALLAAIWNKVFNRYTSSNARITVIAIGAIRK